MKLLSIIAFPCVFAGVFAGVIHTPRADQDDTLKSCDGVIVKSKWLHANCWVQKDGQWSVSETNIDLNSCVANVDGTMVGVAEGNFGKTCKNTKVSREHNNGPVTLTATCGSAHGKVDASTKLGT
ncbi:hypothetical protein F4801DRAFT_583688 [Xylaria longipes]|nr:hypothetical protein F4801DRAFT_583688 [Xylaria longipes]